MDRPHSPGQRPGTSLVSFDPRMEVMCHVPGQFDHWIKFAPGNLKIALKIILANRKIAMRIYFFIPTLYNLRFYFETYILNFLALNYFATFEFSKLFFFPSKMHIETRMVRPFFESEKYQYRLKLIVSSGQLRVGISTFYSNHGRWNPGKKHCFMSLDERNCFMGAVGHFNEDVQRGAYFASI